MNSSEAAHACTWTQTARIFSVHESMLRMIADQLRSEGSLSRKEKSTTLIANWEKCCLSRSVLYGLGEMGPDEQVDQSTIGNLDQLPLMIQRREKSEMLRVSLRKPRIICC